MKKYRLLLLFILSLCLPLQTQAAQSESPYAEMNRLVTTDKFEEALDLGSRNLEDWEGDPEFDFVYGLTALKGGSPNGAVFALERVAATATDGVLRERARLELARAYFVTDNLTAAEILFNVVLTNNPPQNVRQNIEAFLQLIEARRNQQGASFNWSIA